MTDILVPASPADLIDLIVVLQGRVAAATDCVKRAALVQRLDIVRRVAARVLPQDMVLESLRTSIVRARQDVMQLEADLYACEARADFGTVFVALSRAHLAARDDLDRCKDRFDADVVQLLVGPDVADLKSSAFR